MAANTGFINAGTDHKTVALAVEPLSRLASRRPGGGCGCGKDQFTVLAVVFE